MKTSRPVVKETTSNEGNGGNKGKKKKERKCIESKSSDTTIEYKRTDTSKYCWSCSIWNHKSAQCKRKRTVHKNEATLQNKMNGSTLLCGVTQD